MITPRADGSIVIDNWAEGMSKDIIGNQLMRNCEPFEYEGELRGGVSQSKYSVGPFSYTPTSPAVVLGKSGRLTYAVDATLTSKPLGAGSTTTSTWGLRIIDIISYGQTPSGHEVFFISYYDATNKGCVGAVIIDSGTYAHTTIANFGANSINLISTNANGYLNIKLLYSKDGKVYFTNGGKIGYISGITVTDTNVTATTVTNNALDLGAGQYAHTLADLGQYLMIGTRTSTYYMGNSVYETPAANAALYRWDRTSSSFNIPIELGEPTVNAMVSMNNICYFSAGYAGNIYATDGVNVTKIQTIKPSPEDYPLTVEYNCMAIDGDYLYVGISLYGNTFTYQNAGVYKIAVRKRGYPYVLYYSNNNVYGNNMFIGAVTLNRKTLYVSAYTPVEPSNNIVAVSKGTSSAPLRYISPQIILSTNVTTRTFKDITILFNGAGYSGEQIELGIAMLYNGSTPDTIGIGSSVGSFTTTRLGQNVPCYGASSAGASVTVPFDFKQGYGTDAASGKGFNSFYLYLNVRSGHYSSFGIRAIILR